LTLEPEGLSEPAATTSSSTDVEQLRRKLRDSLKKKDEKQRGMELLEKELEERKRT
jgi:hypothetical protein